MLTTPDHSDAATARPALSPVGPKPRGYYQDCDSATGAEGTAFRAEEFNELADNLRQVVFTAGAVAPSKGATTMLFAALHRLYSGAVHSVVATTVLTPDYAGLVLVDATSADITLTMPAAAVLPSGSQAITFLRIDSSTHVVRLVPASGDAIVRGVIQLASANPVTLRSDGTLRWYVVSGSLIFLAGNNTLAVNPATGSATPADPLGGNPFQTIPQAMAYLNRFILVPGCVVVINVAAGTHVFTVPLDLTHPQATQIGIVGAGSASTILRFDACDGVTSIGDLPSLSKLTILGNGGTNKIGIGVGGHLRFDADVIVDSWSGIGIALNPGAYLRIWDGNVLIIRNCADSGLVIATNAFVEASPLSTRLFLQSNGITKSVTQCACYGGLSIREFWTTGGGGALQLMGAAGSGQVYSFNVRDSTATGSAVTVQYGALLKGADPNAPAGTWTFANAAGSVYYTLYANLMANVIAWTALAAGNRSITTPAVNTLGNTQSYIQAT